MDKIMSEEIKENINKVKKNIIDDSVPVSNNPNILKWLVE